MFIILTPFIPLSMIWIYNSLYEGEPEVLKGLRPFNLPLINDLRDKEWLITRK